MASWIHKRCIHVTRQHRCRICVCEHGVIYAECKEAHDGWRRTKEGKEAMSKGQLNRRKREDPNRRNPNRRFKTCTKCKTIKYRKEFSRSAFRPDGLNGWCKMCIKIQSKKYLKSKARQSKMRRAEIRLEVLTHYSKGRPKCACCRIGILEFLSMDHIKGGGSKHKREVVGGHLYTWLRMNKFPKGFRVLCHNCNQSLGAYGYCPHKRKKNAP